MSRLDPDYERWRQGMLWHRNLPAPIFLVAGRVATTGAFWPDEVCRAYRALPKEERRALAARVGVATREKTWGPSGTSWPITATV